MQVNFERMAARGRRESREFDSSRGFENLGALAFVQLWYD
jgi:hypothetical protein